MTSMPAPLPWRHRHLYRRGGAPGAPATLLADEQFINESDIGGVIVYAGIGDDGSGKSILQTPIGGSGAFMDLATSQTIAGSKTFATGLLSSTSGAYSSAFSVIAMTANTDAVRFEQTRTSSGSDWTTAALRLRRWVDTSAMGYVEFSGTNNAVRVGNDTGLIAQFDASGLRIPNAPAAGDSSNLVPTTAWSRSAFAPIANPSFSGGITTPALIGALQHYYIGQLSGGAGAPVYTAIVNEALSVAGPNFYNTFAIISNKNTGGTGNRSALYVYLTANDGANGDQVTATTTYVELKGTASGSIFGGNPGVIVGANCSQFAEAVGTEIDVAVYNASVVRKVGLHVIDFSSGFGSTYDAGILFGCATGANGQGVGFGSAIQIGFVTAGGTLVPGVKTSGTILSTGAGLSVANGIDFSQATFSGNAFKSKSFQVTDAIVSALKAFQAPTGTVASHTAAAAVSGLIQSDATYLYVSTGVNTWARIAYTSTTF